MMNKKLMLSHFSTALFFLAAFYMVFKRQLSPKRAIFREQIPGQISRLCVCSLLFFSSAFAQAATNNIFQHPFYIGLMGGAGSTTWAGLVPTKANQNVAMSMSTPIHVQESGSVWGALLGYEFSPYFAIEANYMHYPQARVFFDSLSMFSFDHEVNDFSTETDLLSLMAKVMVLIPDTKTRVFSSAGMANVYRKDIIIDHSRITPTFGVGVNYHFTPRFMGELGGNFTAGYGESQLSPADTYFPFLYSVSLRLAYCF